MTTKRLLIFNVNWLGDVLFSTAAIRNLRRNFPKSFIACIIPSRCYQILKGNPNLDEIIIFDERDRHRSLWAKIRFIALLKKKKFDSVFLLHRSFTRALICYLAGIPERIGYYRKKRGWLLTKNIEPRDPNSMHRIDYYMNIIEKAGINSQDRFLDFFFDDKDGKYVDEFLLKNSVREKDFVAGINPGGNWESKRWPKEYWSQLADRLIKEFKAKVIITGGQRDLSLAQEIRSSMQSSPIVACGWLNLKQFAALAKRLSLFITADSGPLHIANAVGANKIIALFGPTSFEITGPYPLKNVAVIKKEISCEIPCYTENCRDRRCMKAISPEDVIREIKSFSTSK